MRVISIQSLLCCFMFLSHGTDEIDRRCKKKKKKPNKSNVINVIPAAPLGLCRVPQLCPLRPQNATIYDTNSKHNGRTASQDPADKKAKTSSTAHTQTSPHLIRIKGRC